MTGPREQNAGSRQPGQPGPRQACMLTRDERIAARTAIAMIQARAATAGMALGLHMEAALADAYQALQYNPVQPPPQPASTPQHASQPVLAPLLPASRSGTRVGPSVVEGIGPRVGTTRVLPDGRAGEELVGLWLTTGQRALFAALARFHRTRLATGISKGMAKDIAQGSAYGDDGEQARLLLCRQEDLWLSLMDQLG